MDDAQVGIAQISNRVVIPPDGLTFTGSLDEAFLGYACMALPLTPAKPTPVGPTGNQCWTVFLATKTFQGPLAFFVPEMWSRLSRSYSTIERRGLDARPGVIGSGGMEFGAVPQFRAVDVGGRTYSRIPRLRFPVDEGGASIFLQDVTLYSKETLYHGVESWAAGAPSRGHIGTVGATPPLSTAATFARLGIIRPSPGRAHRRAADHRRRDPRPLAPSLDEPRGAGGLSGVLR